MQDSRSAEAIEDEIELTRSRIESRLETLSHSISPENLIARVLGTDNRSLPDALNAAVDLARTNPIAACLAAAGIAGLVAGANRDGEPATRRPVRTFADKDPARRVAESAAALKARTTAAAENVQETAAHLASTVEENASAATGAVADAAVEVSDYVAGLSEYVRDTASSFAEGAGRAYDRVETSGKTLSEQVKTAPVKARAGGEYAVAWVKENPVTAGLMAVAAGAAAASIVASRRSTAPTTRWEATRELYDAAHENEPDPTQTTGRTVAPTSKQAPQPIGTADTGGTTASDTSGKPSPTIGTPGALASESHPTGKNETAARQTGGQFSQSPSSPAAISGARPGQTEKNSRSASET